MKQPFYVGQKVVALDDYNYGDMFKKGQVFPVIGIRKSVCNCKGWEIYIGLHFDSSYDDIGFCFVCKKEWVNKNPEGWFDTSHFAPYDPPRHENVEIAADLLTEPVDERIDLLPVKTTI